MVEYDVGFDDEGKVAALKIRGYFLCGAEMNLGYTDMVILAMGVDQVLLECRASALGELCCLQYFSPDSHRPILWSVVVTCEARSVGRLPCGEGMGNCMGIQFCHICQAHCWHSRAPSWRQPGQGMRGCVHVHALDQAYAFPDMDLDLKLVRTNLAPRTIVRGPGFVNSVMIIEQVPQLLALHYPAQYNDVMPWQLKVFGIAPSCLRLDCAEAAVFSCQLSPANAAFMRRRLWSMWQATWVLTPCECASSTSCQSTPSPCLPCSRSNLQRQQPRLVCSRQTVRCHQASSSPLAAVGASTAGMHRLRDASCAHPLAGAPANSHVLRQCKR